MSVETEDQHGLNQLTDSGYEQKKKVKISYTRDFLLSLSDLEVCKSLPDGFDASLLSDFEDTSQDRYRIPGTLSSQTFRRNEYGSSPPTRGDASNYSRCIQGRWDSRSSGRSDRDSDSQSDRDSDTGRRYSNQSRRPWQVPEHDGLLGSGSFPRPSGYASAGATAPKLRSTDQFQLSKSNEPYHPPRPYKAMPHPRRDTDAFNDETFGSSECTSEDRAEEERKRRASFESMRKEQHKAFQEQQKLNPEKRKDEFDISLLREDSKDDKRLLNRTDESETVVQSTTELERSSSTSAAPVSRPLVPPGFASTVSEKTTGTKSLINPQPSEASSDLEGGLLHTKGNCVVNGTRSNQEEKLSLEQIDFSVQLLGGISLSGTNKNESKTVADDSRLFGSSKISEASKASENDKVMELDAENVIGYEVVGKTSSAHPGSILDKLFGGASQLNGDGPSIMEHHDTKVDDSWSPRTVQSSKFAQWFLEEENKPIDDLSSGRPNDLLSLIVGGDKGGSEDVDVKKHISPNLFSIQSPELVDSHMSTDNRPADLENTGYISKAEKVSAVLTCEDLEQSILSEVAENGSALLQPVQGWRVTDTNIQKQKADIDDQASQHLLSLLQKGTGPNDMGFSANLGLGSSEKLQNSEAAVGISYNNSKEADAEKVSDSAKPLTLETLFGTAFMKELQPLGAPVSGLRGLVGDAKGDVSESHGLPLPQLDDRLLAPAEIPSSISRHGSGAFASNQRQQMKSDRIEEQLLGFDPRNKVELSHLRTELGSNFGVFDGSTEIQLPEEDSLIAVSNAPRHQNFMPTRNSANADLLPIQETPVDIVEKLAALNSAFRDERSIGGRQDGPPFLRGAYDMREPDIISPHIQSSSPQRYPNQLNHGGPILHSLDSHPANINAQMKFMVPDNVIHHDAPNHQFPPNMLRPPFQPPSTTVTGFDPPTQNRLVQQMHLSGNFPPHLLQALPRGAPPPPHSNTQVTGFIQEPPQMQGFPFGQRQQPNFGGLGVPPQGPDVGGGHHPEALQRLIEMELRSNSKQMRPFPSTAHGPGMYGHELGMGFGYR
ncbi:hypothetical protein Tsubulata_031410 [Turnera subulata]|uniref:Uncharacterized protein n=1 Tax=Turnera subulata TaxID=218843 RepID=A0A9Q0J8N2_9ROSI|nr:hypothetical protein Tsubulata_031410 [Turnera subulata]